MEITVGVLATVAGALLCFVGYRFLRFALALWGFLVGFWAGSTVMAAILGTQFLADLLGWLVGLAVGVGLAAMSYLTFSISVAVLAGAVGASVGAFLAALAGDAGGPLTIALGTLGAGLGVALAIWGDAPSLVLILFSSLAGASTLVTGLILLVGQESVVDLRTGGLAAVLQGGPIWLVTAAILAAIGFAWQMTRPRVEVGPAWASD